MVYHVAVAMSLVGYNVLPFFVGPSSCEVLGIDSFAHVIRLPCRAAQLDLHEPFDAATAVASILFGSQLAGLQCQTHSD